MNLEQSNIHSSLFSTSVQGKIGVEQLNVTLASEALANFVCQGGITYKITGREADYLTFKLPIKHHQLV